MASRFKRQRAQQAQKPPPAQPIVDDEDYLSAAFVTEQPKAPGVPNSDQSKRAKRLADPSHGRVLSNKDIAKKMEDRREEGLQHKIGEDNAGFRLLMKLGYKGGGLGKDGAGSINPITPEMKSGRAGLGKESETKRRKEEAKERARARAAREAQREVERRQRFRSTKAAEFEDRRLQQELSKAQRIVENLDDADGRPRSIMWPEEPTPDEATLDQLNRTAMERWGADQGGGSSTTLSIAATLTSDAGDTSDTLGSQGGKAGGEVLGVGEDAREEWDMMPVEDKLLACLTYLRSDHFYCMYCGCKYDGEEDLQASCPGPRREDHDEEEL